MKSLLIANRGEIALRIQRTAHRMGIATVAVYSDADAASLHVRGATQAVALGGNTSAESYLHVDKLIAAAHASGVDAVHPGYGFLSENAGFAQAVIDAGLTWVGPPPAAIDALGNKARAKQLAQSLTGQFSVPCLPGYQGADQSDDTFVRETARVGYPVMVKATAGGGGRGMRLVTTPDALLTALQSARSEALSAFGSDELLIERALLNPRHVEVQVFADAHGHCVHLGERDCSVQRRHQKIIEETPSPAVDAALRARMGACAVALAQSAGYVGAGTVEFLVEGDEFFLMEMNTRLQVEHPVTEAVTGLDLVEWQIRVARGEPLPRTQSQITFTGHAVEVRLCAEDEAYVPHTGTVLHFAPPAAHSLRFDHALEVGTTVSPYYDAMLGKLIAHAATRDEALDQLSLGLAQLQVLGLPTNRAFLRACLDHPTFRAGRALIPFLAEHGDGIRESLKKQEQTLLTECAERVVFNAEKSTSHPTSRLTSRPTSHPSSLPAPFPRAVRLRHRDAILNLSVRELGAGRVDINSTVVQSRTGDAAQACCSVGDDRWHVQSGGVDLWLDDVSYAPPVHTDHSTGPRDIRAPFNGKLVRVSAVGQVVAKGDTLAVIESMKIEHAIAAPQAGVVQAVAVEVGMQVLPNQVLVTVLSGERV